jgi:hypothetical protein
MGVAVPGSVCEERIPFAEASVIARSTLLPCPAIILSSEPELLASTLPALLGLRFGKSSRSAGLVFGWHSWITSTRAAKTTVPKTPAASQTVSRLNLLIVSPVT